MNLKAYWKKYCNHTEDKGLVILHELQRLNEK